MAKASKRKEILVFADWHPLGEPQLIGYLYSELVRGSEIFSFNYSAAWLASKHALQLDPQLQNFSGVQYPSQEHKNFGVFLDSSPDRWGRVLMKRREAILARSEDRKQQTLTESDFLLGVYDQNRIGGLRFKIFPDGNFMNSDHRLAVPPWSSIAELQHASLMIEQSEEFETPEYNTWLNQLIAPGSSLGGARPKASIADAAGELWIAKFPSALDTRNTGAWEMVVHELAKKSGIHVPKSQAIKFSGKHHTFLVKRFDRNKRKRIHFTSAMTSLAYHDGDNFQSGVSYLEIAEYIMRCGADVNRNLEELWKRIVFSVAVSNTDDHLRNHGFLLRPDGWELSPVYDVNPNPSGGGLSLNISETDNSLSFELVLETAEFYRLEHTKAKRILKAVIKIVSTWAATAIKHQIPKPEIAEMESAFRIK